MNICIDARPIVDATRGGIGRVALRIIDAYAIAAPDDTLFCITTGAQKPTLPEELTKHKNIRHIHLNIPNKAWSLLAMIGAASLVRATEKRVNQKMDAAFFPNIGFCGSIPKRTPHVLLIHDLSFMIEPAWFTWKQRLWHRAVNARKLIRQAPHLLAVSKTTKRDMMQLLAIPASRIGVIAIGSTLSTMEEHPTNKIQLPASSFVLALGAGDARKNISCAIEAVRLARQKNANQKLELVIVGTTRPERDPWIHVINRPTDAELASLYQRADAFLYPSWYEGYGLPLHEAARFGTPVIASTSGALPETAPIGTVFANPAKPHHWAEALQQTIARAEPRPQLPPTDWTTAATELHNAITKVVAAKQ